MTKKKHEKLLSLKEAAERLGVSDWTVRRWALKGRITSAVLGGRRLIPESTVERMIAKNTQTTTCADELKLD